MQFVRWKLVVLLCLIPVRNTLLAGELSPEQLQKARQAFKAEKDRIVESLKNETVIESLTLGAVRQPFKSAEVRKSVSGKLDTSLTVDYADHPIWSVKDNKTLTLHHRCYEGKMIGPTFRVKPGGLLRVHIINRLKNPNQNGGGDDHSSEGHLTPLRFNTTNLHTHGLHVSPAGNSDNVLIHIKPGQEFQNEIYIPENHPAGTFWYHAHVHGSTAIQVSSAMSGALIVEGGLDDIPKIAEAEERVFMFQQIPHHPKAGSDDVVEVENFEEVMGPGKWPQRVAEGRWRTTINGQTIPIITMRPGEVQRWRFIHGGVRETIDVELEGHQLHEIAADGLSFGKIKTVDSVTLNPGYRSDVLVKANPAPNGPVTTFLIDRETDADESLLVEPEPANVLAVVVIAGPPANMSLPANSELAPTKPFQSIANNELEPTVEKVKFNIDVTVQPPQFQINGVAFDPKHEPRKLKLGTANEWELTSGLANHPFHIHVNPFEIVEIRNRDNENILTEPIWKDTILVPRGWKIRVRSRYERYIGRFVLHCHILDHEDQGMMQMVEIIP